MRLIDADEALQGIAEWRRGYEPLKTDTSFKADRKLVVIVGLDHARDLVKIPRRYR